jgi:hypothetical protein
MKTPATLTPGTRKPTRYYKKNKFETIREQFDICLGLEFESRIKVSVDFKGKSQNSTQIREIKFETIREKFETRIVGEKGLAT